MKIKFYSKNDLNTRILEIKYKISSCVQNCIKYNFKICFKSLNFIQKIIYKFLIDLKENLRLSFHDFLFKNQRVG